MMGSSKGQKLRQYRVRCREPLYQEGRSGRKRGTWERKRRPIRPKSTERGDRVGEIWGNKGKESGRTLMKRESRRRES